MKGIDLHIWRRERKVTQADLAKALGVTRQTVANWEADRHLMPATIAADLERMAYTLMPKPIKEAPQFITPEATPTLYQRMYGIGTFKRSAEHPHNLIKLGLLEWSSPDGLLTWETIDRWEGKFPLALLETPEYKQAVADHRAGRRNPAIAEFNAMARAAR